MNFANIAVNCMAGVTGSAGSSFNVAVEFAVPLSDMYRSVRFAAGCPAGLRKLNCVKSSGLKSRILKTKFVAGCWPAGATTKPPCLAFAIAAAATTGAVLLKTMDPSAGTPPPKTSRMFWRAAPLAGTEIDCVPCIGFP